MTIPVFRQRAKKPKTRTGCYSCKARHVKCDEEKPDCRRCTSAGRVCEGYAPIRRQEESGLLQGKPLQPRPPPIRSLAPAIVSSGASEAERKAIDFFHRRTAVELFEHRPLLERCLQMSIGTPAVAHIAAGLGSIHRAHLFSRQAALHTVDDDFADNQHAKALTALCKYIGTASTDYTDTHAETVLLISLLFFYFELYRARDHAASMHLHSSLRVLQERNVEQNRSSGISFDKRLIMMDTQPGDSLSLLQQIYVRLDGDPVVNKGQPSLRPIVRDPLPSSFSSLDLAMIHLDALSASIYEVGEDLNRLAIDRIETEDLMDHPGPGMITCLAAALSRTIDLECHTDLAAQMQDSRNSLHRWLAAIACIPCRPDQEHVHVLARIRFYCLWFEILSWEEPDEMYTDKLQKEFTHIIDQCQRYIDIHSPSSSQGAPEETSSCHKRLGPIPSLGTPLVQCLCVVAFKCRDSTVRRRCVHLLSTLNLQGIFDTPYLVAFVNAIVTFEEGRARTALGIADGSDLLFHQVPAEARLLEVDLDRSLIANCPQFYKDSLGSFVYAARDNTGVIKVQTEFLLV